MLSTKEVTTGQFVKSKAGRDKDRVFIIISILDDEYVLVADGDLRRMENPKKKKSKHLSKYKLISDTVKNNHLNLKKITNSIIKKEIEKYGLNKTQI